MKLEDSSGPTRAESVDWDFVLRVLAGPRRLGTGPHALALWGRGQGEGWRSEQRYRLCPGPESSLHLHRQHRPLWIRVTLSSPTHPAFGNAKIIKTCKMKNKQVRGRPRKSFRRKDALKIAAPVSYVFTRHLPPF